MVLQKHYQEDNSATDPAPDWAGTCIAYKAMAPVDRKRLWCMGLGVKTLQPLYSINII
jgi:hypothetical protein